MEFVMGISQSVVVMQSGQVIAEGTPAEIRASEEVRRAYGQSL
jgi:ABC-type branched-subunit amino acid transport system ATPase component